MYIITLFVLYFIKFVLVVICNGVAVSRFFVCVGFTSCLLFHFYNTELISMLISLTLWMLPCYVQIANVQWTRMQHESNVCSHSTNCVATKFSGRFVESSFSSESSSPISSSSSMARRRDNDELLLLSSPSPYCCCCWRKKCDSKNVCKSVIIAVWLLSI